MLVSLVLSAYCASVNQAFDILIFDICLYVSYAYDVAVPILLLLKCH